MEAERKTHRIIVRFRREQHDARIRHRCERLGIELTSAWCTNGIQHRWVLEVSSDPQEAIRRHAALRGTVVFAEAVTPRRLIRKGRR